MKSLPTTNYKLPARMTEVIQSGGQTNRGMTFIELIVVLGIFSVISGIVLFNFSDFNNNITLQNLAQNIAMKIKQAQTYAMTGKNPQIFVGACPNATDCRPSYGVSFKTNSSNQFEFFADLNNDSIYNESPLETVNIQTKDTIKYICLDGKSDRSFSITSSGEFSCANRAEDLDIFFKRPLSDAMIKSASAEQISDAEIVISSAKGKLMTIVVWNTGQISVE